MELGGLIRSAREHKNLTREQLAEDICSPKYIYLIEKGERTPSVGILDCIGRRLNIEVFSYLPYLDCVNPVVVRKYCKLFNESRKSNDYARTQQLTNEAMAFVDFQKLPWKREIDFNRVKLLIFKEEVYEEAYIMIQEILKEENLPLECNIDTLIDLSASMIQFYNLLSIYFKRIGETNKQINYLNSLATALKHHKHISSYQRIYISVMLNLTKAHFNTGNYIGSRTVGIELLEYQREKNLVDRMGITYFVLGKCYYHLGQQSEAVDYFQKAVFLCYSLDYDLFLTDILNFIETMETNENQMLINFRKKMDCFVNKQR